MCMGRSGVPCILTNTVPGYLADPQAVAGHVDRAGHAAAATDEGCSSPPCSEEEAKLISEYLSNSRINWNVRQVFPESSII